MTHKAIYVSAIEQAQSRESQLESLCLSLASMVRDLSMGWPERELAMSPREALQKVRALIPAAAEIPPADCEAGSEH